MADEADANRIQNVSFALVPPSARRGPEALQRYEARQAERSELLAALDAAALAVDHDAWVAAADVFLADLTQVERRTVEVLLSRLNMAQMSSGERGGNSN